MDQIQLNYSGCGSTPTITWEYNNGGGIVPVPVPNILNDGQTVIVPDDATGLFYYTIICDGCIVEYEFDTSTSTSTLLSSTTGGDCEACLTPVHNCIEMCFNGLDPLEAIGSPAALDVPDMVARITEGTTMVINNVTYLFTATGDGTNNELPLPASATVLGSTITNIINANYALCDTVLIQDTFAGITLTGLDCKTDITISFKDLIADAGGLTTFSDFDNATGLETKKNYKLCVKLICNGEECELEVIPFIKYTEDGCDIDSVEACKDISGYLRGCVSTPRPECYQVNEVTYENFITTTKADVSYELSEAYGSPLNFFQKQLSEEPFTIYNGATQPGTSLDAYCGNNPSAVQQHLSVYEFDDTVCLDQCMFLYFDMPDNNHFISHEITLYGKDGSVLLSYPFPGGFYTGQGTLRLAAGICQFKPIFDQLGFSDYNLIGSYSIATFNNMVSPSQTKSAFTRFQVECCDCKEEFLFLNTLGTYDVMTTDCISGAQVAATREFIRECQPCKSGVDDAAYKNIGTDAYRQFTANIDPSKVSENLLCEFLGSTDVYWKFENNWYWVQPIGTAYVDLLDCKDQAVPYQFRIHSKNNIKQC